MEKSAGSSSTITRQLAAAATHFGIAFHCTEYAHFSEQNRPPIFGGIDQHLNSKSPFPRIALRFRKFPNVIGGVAQRFCRALPRQRYRLIKWPIPRHKRHSIKLWRKNSGQPGFVPGRGEFQA
jgi:hypothetical protein